MQYYIDKYLKYFPIINVHVLIEIDVWCVPNAVILKLNLVIRLTLRMLILVLKYQITETEKFNDVRIYIHLLKPNFLMTSQVALDF